LGLNNLIVIYDDNHISIDGDTKLSFTEDTAKRYKAYNWNVVTVGGDGNDMESFERAVRRAKKEKNRPTIIKLRTHIAFGCPNKQDTSESHGSPLGADEIKLVKEKFGWDGQQSFVVPEEALAYMRKALDRGKRAEGKWNKMLEKYAQSHPQLAEQFRNGLEGKLTVNIDQLLPKFDLLKDGKPNSIATRSASGKTLDALMPHFPLILGGSADLTPSNNTKFTGAKDFQKDSRDGRYIRYGVREHAMGAVMNGISISGLTRAYGGTFFVFSDYMRPAIRLAALSKYPTIFVFTHDSIGVGEDGPTHQAVEQLASLRAMPGLNVFRPADANETAQAWKHILEHQDEPAALLLTRQGLPVLDQNKYGSAKNLSKGAYVLVETGKPDVLLLASGSEISIALCAAEGLAKENIRANVISMPCWELFEKQSKEYKDSVLPPAVKARVGIEAGVEQGWGKWLGDKGIFVGMSSFGASAPYKVCYEKFGITANAVIAAVKKQLGR
jgi:transketolase